MTDSAAHHVVPTPAQWDWMILAPTVGELIAARAAASPERLFLVDEHGTRITFGELPAMVDRCAAALAAHGIRPGSVVAWQLPTRLSTVIVSAALRRLGALQAPVIVLYRQRELTAALEAVDAQFLLTPGTWKGHDYTAMAKEIADSGGPAPTLLEIGLDAPQREDVAELPPPETDPDAVRWVYFTSGSTGVPKGARHTDRTLITGGSAFAGIGGLGRRSDEFGAMAFPIGHIGGWQYLIVALTAGFPLLVLEAFVPETVVALFREHRVTMTGGAPAMYQALVSMARAWPEQPMLPDLRLLKGGGSPCSPDLFDAVRDVLGVTVAHDYGMTEVPMVCVADPTTDPAVLAVTDGLVIPGNEVRFVGLDSVPVPEGETGQVEVRGAAVCHGYTDADATAAAFTEDGWYRTGDLGRRHPSGHVEVLGRLKEMIIRKGENIAPMEIEELISRLPGIAEVAVIGLPDEERGERVCAVVVTAPGATAPTLADLMAYLTEQGLMKVKLPEQLEVVDELPRTGLSKVAKAQLRARFTPAAHPITKDEK